MNELIRLCRPLHLLLAALTYAMGAATADYLGEPFVLAGFWLGLIVVLMAQACMALLSEVFRPVNEPIVPGESRAARQDRRNQCLYLALGALAVLVAAAFLMFVDRLVSPPAVLFLGASVLIPLLYAVPPFRLLNRGFGEFLLSIQIACVSPVLSFLLQAGEFHRLVGLTVVPLTAVALAYFLVMNFPAFAVDQKYERRTLLVLLGWERVVPLHHGLLLLAYLLFALAGLLGFPPQLLWPAFITLPFAVLQMYYLRNIALGVPPNWTLLTVNALAVFGLTAYFLTLTFYLR